MYSLIRKAIFSLDPETAHDLVIKSLHVAGKSPCQFLLKQLLACPQGTPKQVMGITFKNPIGLAAGADKNAEAIDGFGAMGFGFIEVGTVTPLARSRSATLSACSAEISARATATFCSQRFSASALPIRPAPPVTTATRFSNFICTFLLFGG